MLLVEDDPAIRISLTRALGAKGHTIASVPHGGGALSTVLRKQPDLVVLDLGLPDMDGRDVLTMLRGVSDVPVIVATARDDEQEIIRLLDAGADDYVVKPFGASQLDARIRAVLRRTSEAGPPAPLVVGELSIDARTREARLAVARRLGEGDLDARARRSGLPELDEVATTLNSLAHRIRELLAHERESVADLSHRVRTPLTVLRIESEALSDPAEAERITQAVDAVERAVNQAIVDARQGVRAAGKVVASPSRSASLTDAASVVRNRVEFWRVLAEEEHRHVVADVPTTPLPVCVPAEELAAMVDAVLGNVFAHTPEGTAFQVSLRPGSSGGAVLVVADDGPGILDGAKVLDRGTSGAGSTGLGLDIVRRTAEASGGRVSIGRSRSSGAQVTVELGPRG